MRLITLVGTDVDDPMSTARAVLDGPISADVSIMNATARTVSYLYEGPVATETMDPETGVFLVDSFRFRLVDAHGATSFATNVTVEVRSPIVATPTEPQVRDAAGTTGLVPACYLDLPPPAPAK